MIPLKKSASTKSKKEDTCEDCNEEDCCCSDSKCSCDCDCSDGCCCSDETASDFSERLMMKIASDVRIRLFAEACEKEWRRLDGKNIEKAAKEYVKKSKAEWGK